MDGPGGCNPPIRPPDFIEHPSDGPGVVRPYPALSLADIWLAEAVWRAWTVSDGLWLRSSRIQLHWLFGPGNGLRFRLDSTNAIELKENEIS